jgi:hypothetical protein
MTSGGSTIYTLQLKRSPQSGSKALIVGPNFQVVFTDSSAQAYLFGGGVIDLSSMQAGDSLQIRIRKKLSPTGVFTNHDLVQYNDAQPVNHPVLKIAQIPDVYGVEISFNQSAGIPLTIPAEFYVAK